MEDTLSNLSAYLIMDEASERMGLRVGDYGLTGEEAQRAAKWFARYDENGDRRIEPRELARLVSEMMPSAPMTEEEAGVALEILDRDGNGVVDFEEFVSWLSREKVSRSVDLDG